MDSVDGAVLITKRVMLAFIETVQDISNVVVHATCTGYGGTVLEQNVPTMLEQFNSVLDLVQAGFPKERIVIQLDPIIPTPKGLRRALNVFSLFTSADFSRYRVSIIDMYPFVQDRFLVAGLPLPYGDRLAPRGEDWRAVNKLISDAKIMWASGNHAGDLRIEACAEPTLTEVIRCGCVSEYDLRLMGLIDEGEKLDSVGYQRRDCLCYSGKVELLSARKPCSHLCLYYFWKDVKK